MKVIVALCLFVGSALSNAAVVLHDNASGSFVWVGNGNSSTPGGVFNPTLGPGEQTLVINTRALTYSVNLGGSSTLVGSDAMLNAGGFNSIRIATSSNPFIVFGPDPGQETAFARPPIRFDLGQQVGAVPEHFFFAGGSPVAAFNINLGRQGFLGDRGFIGFRVLLDDGLPHFGWMEVEFRESPVLVGPGEVSTRFMYQPIRWAYETEPNTPITIVPAPAATGVCVAVSLLGLRRRRTTT